MSADPDGSDTLKTGGGMNLGDGVDEGVAVESKEDSERRNEDLLGDMLGSYRIRSMDRVKEWLLLNPELSSLADSMVVFWSLCRERAMKTAVHLFKHPEDKYGREEFYRHVASTHIPCVELVLKLRSQLLEHRSITHDRAKEMVRSAAKNPRYEFHRLGHPDVQTTVTKQLLNDAQTLMNVAKGKDENDEALAPSDQIEHGWMAVKMLDGGQRLVLIEISAIVDIEKPCQGCKTVCRTRCARCHAAFYCTTECQAKQWPDHKPKCSPKHKNALAELRAILAQEFQPVVLTCPPAPDKEPTKQHKPKFRRTK